MTAHDNATRVLHAHRILATPDTVTRFLAEVERRGCDEGGMAEALTATFGLPMFTPDAGVVARELVAALRPVNH